MITTLSEYMKSLPSFIVSPPPTKEEDLKLIVGIADGLKSFGFSYRTEQDVKRFLVLVDPFFLISLREAVISIAISCTTAVSNHLQSTSFDEG
jgi:hypothetical protein